MAQRLDEQGNALSSDEYDAYGNLVTGGDATDPYGYKAQYGYYTDHETGLILCTYRYYDPAAGRWLTRDPIRHAGGLNLYEYCGGDPVNGVDPSGLAPQPPGSYSDYAGGAAGSPLMGLVWAGAWVNYWMQTRISPQMTATVNNTSNPAPARAGAWVVLLLCGAQRVVNPDDVFHGLGGLAVQTFSYYTADLPEAIRNGNGLSKYWNDFLDGGRAFGDSQNPIGKFDKPETLGQVLANDLLIATGGIKVYAVFREARAAGRGAAVTVGSEVDAQALREGASPTSTALVDNAAVVRARAAIVDSVEMLRDGRAFDALRKAAKEVDKRGETQAARKLKSHVDRETRSGLFQAPVDAAGRKVGTILAWNEQALQTLENILAERVSTKVERARNGNLFVEVRDATGRGVRLENDATFTFLDPVRK